MRLLRSTVLTMVLFLCIWSHAGAQDAITFDSLAMRLDPYFAPELLQDVKNALPQVQMDIWGYGVGDYSGDEHNDLIVVLRRKGDARKRMSVYFFVDDEGTLRLIKEQYAEFVNSPIEVGVNIEQGNAYVVQKFKDYQWEISGYRFRSGVIMSVDKFTTERQAALTYESYRNYQSLESYESYLNTANGSAAFRSDFQTLPCYYRGRDVSSGLRSTMVTQGSKNVLRGSYYWTGPEDCSVETHSAYDQDFLYLTLTVHDDRIVTPLTDGPDTTSDRIEVWIDSYSSGNRIRSGKRRSDFRTRIDTNVYAFIVQLGDFSTQPARVKIATSNPLDAIQNLGVRQVKAVSSRMDSTYTVKLRIPFSLIGFNKAPVEDYAMTELGMSVLVYDVDNPLHQNETTVLSTSRQFDKVKPATFGSLVLVPQNRYYGESSNIYLSDLKEHLREIGF